MKEINTEQEVIELLKKYPKSMIYFYDGYAAFSHGVGEIRINSRLVLNMVLDKKLFAYDYFDRFGNRQKEYKLGAGCKNEKG